MKQTLLSGLEHCEYIDVHTHQKNRMINCAIYNLQADEEPILPGLLSAGIHPWHVGKLHKHDLDLAFLGLSTLLNEGRLAAIGECGLDGIKGGDMALQQRIFKNHLELAVVHDLPVILHLVKSDHLSVPMLKEFSKLRFCYHGYNRKPAGMHAYLALNGFISFGSAIMSDSSAALSLAEVPESSLLLETDDATTSIHQIYQRAAEIRGISLQTLKQVIQLNYEHWLRK